MPFRGWREGEIVVPAMVPNDEPVTCPSCQGVMYARGGDDRARHFYHHSPDGGRQCSSTAKAESSTHARCVALAVTALKRTFNPHIERYGVEISLDVSTSATPNKERRADALVEFREENPFFGEGLIIEVQHKHEDKDIEETTHDYLSAGYSVAWLSSRDFGDERLDYSIVNEQFESQDGDGYSVRETSPKKFVSCEAYLYDDEHNWEVVPSYILTCEEEYEICTGRGCDLRRVYDAESSEYFYDEESITTLDLPLRVLHDVVVLRHGSDRPWSSNDPGTPTIKESLQQRYRMATVEKLIATRPEIGECPGPKGFHEWGAPESLWGGSAQVGLRACQHCPTHLLTDLRGYEKDRKDIFFTEEPDPDWNFLSVEADPVRCVHHAHENLDQYNSCPSCGVRLRE